METFLCAPTLDAVNWAFILNLYVRKLVGDFLDIIRLPSKEKPEPATNADDSTAEATEAKE